MFILISRTPYSVCIHNLGVDMATNDLGLIQKSITQRLKGSVDAAGIKELAGTIAALQRAGIRVDDVFPYGVPPYQLEGISIRAHLSHEQMKTLGDIIPKLGGMKEIRVFPRGIVNPENFRLHVNMPR